MEPLRVAVCEDQTAERELLEDMLDRCAVGTAVTPFPSGEALLVAYHPGDFDLLLMDIYMGGISGIETVERVRQADETVPVAFLTSSPDHAMESYRLSALMYLEKPVRQEKLEEMLELARLKRDNIPALTIFRSGEPERVPLGDILCLEQRGRQVQITLTRERSMWVYGKLAALLPQLEGPAFFRPHKSYCVHLSFVREIDRALRCFVLANGKNVPIRRDLQARARRAWEDFLFDRTRGDV